ncbi:spinster family MFS transporter [Rudaea sp.]|uniref:spinster family MFS transporter n=1 Tax=Rudaea sp. TaxID=2136325 RepID=UPI0037837D49
MNPPATRSPQFPSHEPTDPGSRTARQAWIIVALLLGAYVISFLDRQILALMVKPIRADLGISDTQMSLLMGIAFSLFYSLFGIPIARLADRFSRRGVIVSGMALWCLATAMCGLAQRYLSLFLARVGVGVGEAALSPAAYSLICDYFPAEKRASAISLYSTGTSVGAGLALLAGGALIHFAPALDLPLIGAIKPWQTVFLVLGAIGLLYCPLLLLIREPARRQDDIAKATEKLQLRAVLSSNKRTLTLHHLGFAVFMLAAYGSAAWVPVYFMRVQGWTPAHVGLVYGIVIAVFGTLGMIVGGSIADRLFRRGRIAACLQVSSIAALVSIPFAVGVVFAGDIRVQVICLAIATFTFNVPIGLGPAAIQEIVPTRARAQTSAIFLLVVNLVGQGLGPTAVALFTDHVFGRDAAVGLSLIAVNVGALLLAALLLALACGPYRESYRRLRASSSGI